MFITIIDVLIISVLLVSNMSVFKALQLKNLDIQAVSSGYIMDIHQAELRGYSNTLYQKEPNCDSTVTLYVKQDECSLHTNTSLKKTDVEEFEFHLHKNGHVDSLEKTNLIKDCRRTKT
jgi:hypothetical protein